MKISLTISIALFSCAYFLNITTMSKIPLGSTPPSDCQQLDHQLRKMGLTKPHEKLPLTILALLQKRNALQTAQKKTDTSH